MSEEKDAVVDSLPDPRETMIGETHMEERPVQIGLYAVRIAIDADGGQRTSAEEGLTTVETYFVVSDLLGQFITEVNEDAEQTLLDVSSAVRSSV